MPINYSLYDKSWKKVIRPAILERDGNKCVECGVANYSIGYWGNDGKFYTGEYILEQLENTGRDMFSEGDVLAGIDGEKKPIKIILTVSHTDHDINNNEYDNLKTLCQKHHLAHDKEHHMKNSRATNEKKKGLQKLF